MSKFLVAADIGHLSLRKLPTAPDGKYDYQVQPKVTGTPDARTQAMQSTLTSIVNEFKTMVGHGPLVTNPLKTLKALCQAAAHPDGIDDRQGLFVQALAVLCKLPPESDVAKNANTHAIEMLYNSLPHPPATYLAPFPAQPAPQSLNGGMFRSADGGGNNVWQPQLGRAGTPYARDVENKHPLAPHLLPDPGLVFDTLLRAKPGKWEAHPGGNSALTFAFASLVTHSLFRTNPKNNTINDTSSYLDLSVLYGTSDAQQGMVRNKEAGRGLLWKDAFAEDRLVLVPPAATALLVIFSRNHNYIAETILKINERQRWSDPPPPDPAQRATQDEEIFQTARLINSGHFMAMIFGDYVAGFLGLPRDGSGWSMNPFDPIRTDDGQFLGRGEGNHCSVEFNLLYRWHATTAQKDITWTEDLFRSVFGDSKPFDQLTMQDFGPAVVKAWHDLVDPNPRTREFGGIHRQEDGSFKDDDIAKILQDATETPAAAYRAQGTPAVLRIVEIMGIMQGRAWGVCSMNEFRAFLGLKKFTTFEEWSSNKEVAAAARQLYGHIDNLELYPGLQAEDCMPLGPGSGICCGYTMTRAILGDAVALVRGDRFYTTDYTPANLTSWGFQDCARDPRNGAFGAALPKLLLRNLPRHYPADSVYGKFPFFTPQTNAFNLKKLKIDQLYTFTRPKAIPEPKIVDTLKGIQYVLSNSVKFTAVHGTGLVTLERAPVAGKSTNKVSVASKTLLADQSTLSSVSQAYAKLTADLISEHSYTMDGVAGTRVDIVQNVINLVPVRWLSEHIVGMSLKTKAHPRGYFAPQEVYDMLSELSTYVLRNSDPVGGWELKQTAEKILDFWRDVIKENIKESTHRLWNPVTAILSVITTLISPHSKPYLAFLSKVAASKLPADEIVESILKLVVEGSAVYSQTVAQIVNFYLDDARAKERAAVVQLVNAPEGDVKARKSLDGYIREAQRLCPATPALFRDVVDADVIPGEDKAIISVQPGDRIYVSVANAYLNPVDFPNPTIVDPTRPTELYDIPGLPLSTGSPFSQTIPELVKAIFKLKNLRRAENVAGVMSGFRRDINKTTTPVYLDSTGYTTCWPGSMTVVYDS